MAPQSSPFTNIPLALSTTVPTAVPPAVMQAAIQVNPKDDTVVTKDVWEQLTPLNNNVFRVLGISKANIQWVQDITKHIVKANVTETTIAHTISARAFTWFAEKTRRVVKPKDNTAFLQQNGFPATAQRSGIWDKARTIIGQLSRMDPIHNLDVERLANRLCSLVDPVLEELYGANADTPLHLTNPQRAAEIADDLHSKVKQLWISHASGGQSLAIEGGRPSGGMQQEGNGAGQQASGSQAQPQIVGVRSMYEMGFKKPPKRPTKTAEVSSWFGLPHCNTRN